MKLEAIYVIFLCCVVNSIFGQLFSNDLLNFEEEGSGSIKDALRDSVLEIIKKKSLRNLAKKSLRNLVDDFDTESSGDDYDDDDAKLVFDEYSGSGDENVKDEEREYSGEGSGYERALNGNSEPTGKPTQDLRSTLQKIWMTTLKNEARKNAKKNNKNVDNIGVVVINSGDSGVDKEGKHRGKKVKSTSEPAVHQWNKNKYIKTIPYDEILNDVNGVPSTQGNTDTNEVWRSTQDKNSDNDDSNSISLTVFITIAVVIAALVFTILIIVFFVFRLRRKNEASYTLDEPTSAMLTTDTEFLPPKNEKEEFFA